MTKVAVLDTECYIDYWLCKLVNVETKAMLELELHEDCELDFTKLITALKTYTVVTFNGYGYDMLMVSLALKLTRKYAPKDDQTPEHRREIRLDICRRLKAASDWIILGENRKPWEFYDAFECEKMDWADHIDLMELAVGDGSLKLYAGRLHAPVLQDLPLPPEAKISAELRPMMRTYCGHDCMDTMLMRDHLKPEIELRTLMGAGYKLDLRSKSDAQIAEAVIRSEVEKVLKTKVYRPEIPPGTRYQYTVPDFMQFQTPELINLLADIRGADFVVNGYGGIIEPPVLDGRTVKIGNSVYRLGIGGLHSSEKSTAHFSDDEYMLIDRDVTSFYPAIILKLGLYPKHLTEVFLKIFKDIFDKRVAAKAAGQKTMADTFKIVLNGSYGKFGSMWSTLYAPDLMIQVTLTGQLVILMLIEAIERAGISVVSANTDGIVIKCPRSRKAGLDEIIKDWERRTTFTTEETQYKWLCSRDVNNYLALSVDQKTGAEKVKGKGAFVEFIDDKGKFNLKVNPDKAIATEAVVKYLQHGTPIANTVMTCRDIRKFVTVRRVTGGAIKITQTDYDESLTDGGKQKLLEAGGWLVVDKGKSIGFRTFCYPGIVSREDAVRLEEAYNILCGEPESYYVGKVCRWYIARGERYGLNYKATTKFGGHNLVPDSLGAKPCMVLPKEFPNDIDYGAYMAEANSILKDIGVFK